MTKETVIKSFKYCPLKQLNSSLKGLTFLTLINKQGDELRLLSYGLIHLS